jgi:phage terminase large subunit
VPFFNNYLAEGMIHHNSSKSWTAADFLLIKGIQSKKRILCTREVQNSIKDSVHKLLSDQIERLGFSALYNIQRESIIGVNGTEFIFKGLHRNDQDVKSTEGIDYCWVEEAQSVSRDSLRVLIPTIRKENSQIIFTYNPLNKDDPVHTDYTLSGREDVLVIKVNYYDNPFFPEVLKREMEWDKVHDVGKFNHVWLGEPAIISDAQVFKNKFVSDVFESPSEEEATFYFGGDFGFARDPSTIVRSFIKYYDDGSMSPLITDCKDLYIDYEAGGVGVEITELPQLFKSIPGADKWTITADSARPETISYLRNKGFDMRGAKKGPDSVKEGIEFLRSFNKIIIHERCKRTLEEFNFYSYKVDKMTGDILPILLDKHNHYIDALRYSLERFIRDEDDDISVGIA